MILWLLLLWNQVGECAKWSRSRWWKIVGFGKILGNELISLKLRNATFGGRHWYIFLLLIWIYQAKAGKASSIAESLRVSFAEEGFSKRTSIGSGSALLIIQAQKAVIGGCVTSWKLYIHLAILNLLILIA